MLCEGRVSWVTLPHTVPGYFSEARSNVDVEEVLKPPVFLNSPCKKRGGWGEEEEHTSRLRFEESLIFKSKCVFILLSHKSPQCIYSLRPSLHSLDNEGLHGLTLF